MGEDEQSLSNFLFTFFLDLFVSHYLLLNTRPMNLIMGSTKPQQHAYVVWRSLDHISMTSLLDDVSHDKHGSGYVRLMHMYHYH